MRKDYTTGMSNTTRTEMVAEMKPGKEKEDNAEEGRTLRSIMQ